MASGGVLEVVLVDSEGIRAKKFLGCVVCCSTSAVNRPYVCVEYGDKKRVSKVAPAKGKKSVWDQKFEFEVDYPIDEKKSNQKLVFRIMDKHKLSDDGYVGVATIYVKDVVLTGLEKGDAELGSRKYRVVREDKSYTGDISVAVTFKDDYVSICLLCGIVLEFKKTHNNRSPLPLSRIGTFVWTHL